MSRYTSNIHVADETPISAYFIKHDICDFTAIAIGNDVVCLRGDNVERLAGVLNDYIAARATPGREQSVAA